MEHQSNTTFAEGLSFLLWFGVNQGVNLGPGLYCVVNFSQFLWMAGCYLGHPVGALLVKLVINALNRDYGIGYFVEKAKDDGKGNVAASADEHEVIRKRREEAERQVAGAFSLILCWLCMLYYFFSAPPEVWEVSTILDVFDIRGLTIVCMHTTRGALTGMVALVILSGCARLFVRS
ncbi:hypothetical protein KC318_g3913 [Hortaea werneckii]|nr:hypothetical protein KC334_g2028 [Hortaea werneckii]KAI7002304.1 hypothetical protein KC355_g9902 [Hortaea werneckii]KAI7670664.1 hypothetical protein KC318_g3913 [Hortaea werneckii]